jgi:cyclase
VLKKRIIAAILVQNGIVVQSIGFEKYIPVGRPEIAAEFFCQWGADEILLFDISATIHRSGPDLEMVRRVARKCFVPLAVGGGISSLTQVDSLIHGGADKVCLNHVLHNNPEFIAEIAREFGAQSVIACLDAIQCRTGYYIYDYTNKIPTQKKASDYARALSNFGIGELLINSVDRDGSGMGFDLALISEVCAAVAEPVICCGGAGSPKHFLEVFEKTAVHAAAAANFFHYYEHSLTITKEIMSRSGVPVRHDTFANFSDSRFDHNGRILKKPDLVLERLLFKRVEREVV